MTMVVVTKNVVCTYKVTSTSKEKHSLTRKLVGYRNWRQRWCKKEGNKVLGGQKSYFFWFC